MNQVYETIIFNTYNNVVSNSIFGFPEFISAFSILMVLFALTDINYKFRILTTPTLIKDSTLLKEIFYINTIICIFVLLNDFVFKTNWLQTILAVIFVLFLFRWVWYLFIEPPVFGKGNYKKFSESLYKMIINLSPSDLSKVAQELNRSAKNIIKYSANGTLKLKTYDKNNKQVNKLNEINGYAHDILMLIGYRKLCKSIVSDTPITAIVFLEEVAKSKKPLPIGTFLRNIATEAFINKNSNLYHEDNGYNAGLIGFIKPFNNTVFGNCELIKNFPSQSPFDLEYNILKNFDSEQLTAYTRVFFIFINNCLETDSLNYDGVIFSIFNRTLKNIINFSKDAYKLNNVAEIINNKIHKKINIISDFIRELIDNIENKRKEIERNANKKRIYKIDLKPRYGNHDYYDTIAESIMNFLINIASVKEPDETNWWIQHSIAWSSLFCFPDKNNITEKIVHYRLCHLIYNEIKELEQFDFYPPANILGLCLNVMGLKQQNYGSYKTVRALHKFVLYWTQNNYLKLRKRNKDIADAVLMGTISFDEKENRLVKTYAKLPGKEAEKCYLELYK